MNATRICGFFGPIEYNEIAFCEDCGFIERWWRAERAAGGKPGCIRCGSRNVSRGELPEGATWL
jgi:hypothetical protein